MKAYVFPGQGSQCKGMGNSLFERYNKIVEQADSILGYSIKDLCLNNPDGKLHQTQYTQSALFVVNCLSYLDHIENQKEGEVPDYLAGHSLGEYNALYAAGVFSFDTGLEIVKKRGELMSREKNGSMAAIIGLGSEQITTLLAQNPQLAQVYIANYNSNDQVVVAGREDRIKSAKDIFEQAGARYVVLNVSGAFHSPYMNAVRREFDAFIEKFDFLPPRVRVISNVSAIEYDSRNLKHALSSQIVKPVRWNESINYLIRSGVTSFKELGPGNVLTKLIGNMVNTYQDKSTADNDILGPKSVPASLVENTRKLFDKHCLGSQAFKRDYGIDYAYVTGAMYKGVASKELVAKVAESGMLGFIGAGGMSLEDIEDAIHYVRRRLRGNHNFGVNVLNNTTVPEEEHKLVDFLLRLKVVNIEAAGYMQNLSEAIVRFRLAGLSRKSNGEIQTKNKIIAKVSRPEVAEAFMSPAPKKIVDKLLAKSLITPLQAELSEKVPVAYDVCVEADSGGHTDMGVAYTLMPAIHRLREDMERSFKYDKKIRIGAAGGIGTPASAAAAFILGADFILTGSINQCTVESGASELMKDMLESMGVQDTSYAPAGDMFELGAKVQVLRKGVFFPARANKLYDLYRIYNSIEEIDEKTRKQIENTFFNMSFDDVYRETKSYWLGRSPKVVDRAEKSPKFKMALIFKWYFGHATKWAMEGVQERKVDFQIHTGPALGAFNSWVKGTPLVSWRKRNVDQIGLYLLDKTAEYLNMQLRNILV